MPASVLQNVAGRRLEEIDIDDLPMESNEEEDDDVDQDEFSFSTFATMYFQGSATPTYICQRLRQPLLHHEDKEDVLVIVPHRLHPLARLFLAEDCVSDAALDIVYRPRSPCGGSSFGSWEIFLSPRCH